MQHRFSPNFFKISILFHFCYTHEHLTLSRSLPHLPFPFIYQPVVCVTVYTAALYISEHFPSSNGAPDIYLYICSLWWTGLRRRFDVLHFSSIFIRLWLSSLCYCRFTRQHCLLFWISHMLCISTSDYIANGWGRSWNGRYLISLRFHDPSNPLPYKGKCQRHCSLTSICLGREIGFCWLVYIRRRIKRPTYCSCLLEWAEARAKRATKTLSRPYGTVMLLSDYVAWCDITTAADLLLLLLLLLIL